MAIRVITRSLHAERPPVTLSSAELQARWLASGVSTTMVEHFRKAAVVRRPAQSAAGQP